MLLLAWPQSSDQFAAGWQIERRRCRIPSSSRSHILVASLITKAHLIPIPDMAGKSVKLIYQMARPAHRPKPAVLSVLSTKSATIFDEGSRRKKGAKNKANAFDQLRPPSSPCHPCGLVPHVGQDSLINHKISWPSSISRSSSKSGAIIIFIIWQGEAESVPPLPPPPPEPFFPLSWIGWISLYVGSTMMLQFVSVKVWNCVRVSNCFSLFSFGFFMPYATTAS